MAKVRGKSIVKEIALARIERLFELAAKEFERHPERGKRYVGLARALGTRNRVPLPRELKKKFCKRCGAFWVRGKNLKVEGGKKNEKLSRFICGECGFAKKFPA